MDDRRGLGAFRRGNSALHQCVVREQTIYHNPCETLAEDSDMRITIGVRAVFAETENSEMNKILNNIQETIILPAYLPEKQRKLVFDPKMKSYLEQNPIVIEVEGLEHKFSSIDRFTGIENSKAVLAKALKSMQSQEDWFNLGTLLAGYKKAGIRLKANHWGKIVRMAGTSGNIHAIIECAKQSEKTGLLFTNRETVVRVLSFINEKVTSSNWDEAETKQAQKWADQVLDLVQRREHTAEGQPTRERLHFSRVVRGMTLFTRASAIKVKQRAGEAVEQDLLLLQDEVELLNSLWKGSTDANLEEVAEFAKLNPTLERTSGPKGVKIPTALNGSAYVKVLAQNIKGITLAREILGDEAQSLAPVEVSLADHLRHFVHTSKSSTKGWDQEYLKIVGQEPKW
ncbi:hypothetical protein Trco_001037 [Trichoderma cornu-damae]|uniref:Uncharacterized protein n=1 Tax=Trichoderma cornu-damae TaxID=654480 RepID=A0A9P8U0G5_9HYPO|nr:hypothetical protein Trco_001037 [Trichoderma cornu-damae]